MEEEKLEISGVQSQEECLSIPGMGESTPVVGEDRDETISLDNPAVAIEGSGLENQLTEAIGGSEFTATGNELLIDQPQKMDSGDGLSPLVEASNIGSSSLPSELQEDVRGDEIVYPQSQIEIKAEAVYTSVVDSKVEVIETELCDEQEKPAELQLVREEVESLYNSEVATVEIAGGIFEGTVEPMITEEIPLPEVKMNAEIINQSELSGGMANVDSDVMHEHAEEISVTETKMLEDENEKIYLLNASKSDDLVNVVENLDDSMVKEEAQTGDDETKLADSEVETQLGIKEAGDEIQEDDDTMETLKTGDDMPDEDGRMETEETTSDVDEPTQDIDDSPVVMQEEEDETIVADEERRTEGTEMETESGKSSEGKRKRGKLSKSTSISKATTKASLRKKTVGEDVCFICFDGGELAPCNRRGCPKAYHPSCVNRDDAFFNTRGRWNCGCHLCSICEKNAFYMCFTCTYSLCKSCSKDAVILCIRGNKGFCETCMRTVTLIESNEQGNKDTQIDFDDKGNWEHLFKDYYVELKNKLSLSAAEIAEAKNSWKGEVTSKQELSEVRADANDGGSGSDDSTENLEPVRPKRRRVRKQQKPISEEDELGDKDTSLSENSDWASKELLEFVSHMKDGDTSVLSQFDVQALLLEYIKRNKLRDPRRKSQIICDARLENIFVKPRVGHFEMLKLLESHFLTRDEQNDDVQGSVVDTGNSQLDNDGHDDSPLAKGIKDRKRKSRKKSGGRGPQSNLDDYAAIDMHNIGLIYMRRKLMEDLLEDPETFHDKVIGTFVRIRISGSNQKQDLYRIVQVVGTSKTGEPYKVGKKTTDIMVEILNLDKTEIISIDTVSNQEFSEDECKRLRQSIKCGLITRLTVGEILDKTTELQTVRVNDWLESETQRLSHLRDRASDLGRRKELRECVEKLQLLKTPEERRRRLEEFPEIHSDPKMDPSYESEDDDSETEDSRQDAFLISRDSSFSRRGRLPIAPLSYAKDSWTGVGKLSSKNLPSDIFSTGATHFGEIVNEGSWSSEGGREMRDLNNLEKLNSSFNSASAERASRMAQSESFSGAASVAINTPLSTSAGEIAVKINESEKMWHYEDPSGKIQGPFSMVQLRKWNNTGYFPADLKIWKTTEKKEIAIILSDALAGRFPKELPVDDMVLSVNAHHSSHFLAEHTGRNTGTSLHQDRERFNANQKSGTVSNLSTENWRGNDTMNLPSPTPRQSNTGRAGADASLLNGAIQSLAVNGPAAAAIVLPNIGTHSSAVAAASVLNSALQTAPFSPTPNSQQVIQVTAAVPQHTQSTTMSEARTVNMHTHQLALAPVQTVDQNLQNDTQGWGNNTQPPVQQHGYGWGPSNVQTSSGSFSNSGAPSGLQPNLHPPTTPNVSWGINPVDNNTSMGPRPENPNVGWGAMQANPNIAWSNPPAGNTNMNWGPAMQAPPPGNVSGWVAPPAVNNGANVQGMMPGNPNPGWVHAQGWGPPPGQAPTPGNGWGQPSGNAGGPLMVPGPAQGNAGRGWVGNQQQGSWGNGGGGKFPGPRSGPGKDPIFSRPWNRQQSSFARDQNFSRRDTICPYNATGRCRKGVQCDYLHA